MIEDRDISIAMRDGTCLAVETLLELTRDRAWGVFQSFPGHRLDTTVVTEASFCTKRREAASFHESKGEKIP